MSALKLNLNFVIEDEPLGTGGAVLNAVRLNKYKKVTIINADTWLRLGFKDLLNSLPSQKDIDSIYDSNLCWLILGINSAQVEYSAYVPKFIEENTYNFKRINII